MLTLATVIFIFPAEVSLYSLNANWVPCLPAGQTGCLVCRRGKLGALSRVKHMRGPSTGALGIRKNCGEDTPPTAAGPRSTRAPRTFPAGEPLQSHPWGVGRGTQGNLGILQYPVHQAGVRCLVSDPHAPETTTDLTQHVVPPVCTLPYLPRESGRYTSPRDPGLGLDPLQKVRV